MRHRIGFFLLIVIAMLPILSVSAAPQAHQGAQNNEFNRRAMLENLATGIILPLHESFLRQTEVLRAAYYSFQASSTPENLQSLQEAWCVTAQLWYKVKLFRLGRLTFAYQSRIANNVPIATPLIDQLIEGTDTLDADALAVYGSNVVGLRTAEYLIFDPENGNTAVLQKYTDDPFAARRTEYLRLTIEDLYVNALVLLNVWSPDGANYAENFIAADDLSQEGSTSVLVNQMISSLEAMVTMTIGWPVGTPSRVVHPDIVESLYSGDTVQEIRSYFEILRDTINGQGTRGNGLGFDDYLASVGATYFGMPLADALNEQVGIVLRVLDTIHEPLTTALINNPQQVRQLYHTAEDLEEMMEINMASQLGITILSETC